MKVNSSLGQKFGRLLILGQWLKQVKAQRRSYVLAQCDCGVLEEYRLAYLKSGVTKSCGCYRKERLKELNTTHGMIGSSIYRVWTAMIQRCTNSKDISYKNYGGRGIKVCDRWLDIKNFYEDMGDRPKDLELDRTDNNKGYFKENCQWASNRINSQNRRTSKHWYLFGKRYNSCTEASEELGVCSRTVVSWCNGWSRVSKAGTYLSYPPKDGCYSELKYK